MGNPIVGRRDAVRLAGLLVTGATVSTGPAQGASVQHHFTYAPDVVVFCNPTVAQPLRRIADSWRRQAGVPVRIIAAADRIFAAQLARGERNDVCVALAPVAAAMRSAGLVDPQPQVGTWRDRLLVARDGDGPAPVDIARLPAVLGSGRLGAVDASENAIVDTTALLDRLGLTRPLAGRLVGEVDTEGVAFLLRRRDADLGLIFATDQRAGPFTVAATVPDDAYPPPRYACLLNKRVLSSHASDFLAFLATSDARARLSAGGLEIET